MATLTNTKIKDTYDSLLKISDNGIVEATEQVVTDGLGNNTVLSIGTASASFSSDIEVNGVTVGKGNSSVITNTAIGRDALDVNTTGSFNTAIGSSSMNLNTTGGSNVAVGASSLASNVSSSFNTAIGVAALQDNTASNNTAVGYISLSNNTTGSNNTAVGTSSLLNNTTGAWNTAVGKDSLRANTTGSFNSSLGYNSLTTNTTGAYNTGIGNSALLSNSTGSRNTALGYFAGDTITTGTDNLYIGYQADASANNVTNEIVIGASATGNGSNTATYGNASITAHHFTSGQVNITGNLAVDTNTLYVDAANNRVGVGTSSPATTLELNSATSNQAVLKIGRSTNPAITNNLQLGTSGGDSTITAIGTSSVNAALIFQRGTTSVTTESMRIDSSGNVGVKGDALLAAGLGYAGNTTSAGAGTIELYDTSTGAMIINGFGAGYLPNSGIQFQVAGSERMRISSAGNVGIGESSPDNKIHITGNTDATSSIKLEKTGAGTAVLTSYYLGTTTDNEFRFLTNNIERMRIDSSGNIIVADGGIIDFSLGTTSSTTIGMNSRAYMEVERNDLDGNIKFFTTTAGAGFLAERMRIDSSGYVMIGTTDPTIAANATGAGTSILPSGGIETARENFASLYVNRQGTDGEAVSIRKSGVAVGSISVTGSATSYNTSSDYRLKENVVEMTGALDRVDALKPSRFNFIADPETTVDGFIAHEVQAIIPEAVTGEKDAVDEEGNPVYQGIDQSKITPLLTAAIKELKALVEAQQQEINNLKSQING